jgi:hypothetical protein
MRSTFGPEALDVWTASDHGSLVAAGRPLRCTTPSRADGGELASTHKIIACHARLPMHLDEELDVCLIDLSAGRSYATQVVLAATALPEPSQVTARWLVFHRWTRQHIIAAGQPPAPWS